MKGTTFKGTVDFVLKTIKANDRGLFLFVDQVEAIAQLEASQPILGHFIRCDLEGNPLEQPKAWGIYCYADIDDTIQKKLKPIDIELCKAYQEAEARVLWEGDFKWYKTGDNRYGLIIYTHNRERKFSVDFSKTYSDLKDKGLIFKNDLL